jgi:hypothetical protein
MEMTFPQVVQAAKTVHLKFKKMMNPTKLVALKPIKSIFQSPQRMQLVEITVLHLLKASKARRNATTTISRLKKKTMRKKRTRSSRVATPTRAMKKRKMTEMKKNKAKRNSKARNNKSNMKKRIWMKW